MASNKSEGSSSDQYKNTQAEDGALIPENEKCKEIKLGLEKIRSKIKADMMQQEEVDIRIKELKTQCIDMTAQLKSIDKLLAKLYYKGEKFMENFYKTFKIKLWRVGSFSNILKEGLPSFIGDTDLDNEETEQITQIEIQRDVYKSGLEQAKILESEISEKKEEREKLLRQFDEMNVEIKKRDKELGLIEQREFILYARLTMIQQDMEIQALRQAIQESEQKKLTERQRDNRPTQHASPPVPKAEEFPAGVGDVGVQGKNHVAASPKDDDDYDEVEQAAPSLPLKNVKEEVQTSTRKRVFKDDDYGKDPKARNVSPRMD
ncbi:unnamed protein product [Orchesella dallaii]|uniref:Uncharacterized protein n=1 Tax=Orchesella dallaii TaxID=48710 RepID=A0ABP1PTN2_9HEXA